MSGTEIANEVSAALAEVAEEVGDGSFNVTLVQYSGGGTSPLDPGKPTETTTPFRAMVTTYKQGMVDGTLIQAGDVSVFIEAGAVVPTTADRLRIDTGPFAGDYAIIDVMPGAYSGVPLFHRLQCRR